MSVDYIVASLPALVFGQDPALSWDGLVERVPDVERQLARSAWLDLEVQLRNAVAEARDGAADRRPADGCSIYWRNRVQACFSEKDVLRRDELLDRVWWDAAAELTSVTAPLGSGALLTYAVRLRIALKRKLISAAEGNAAFDRLTSGTKVVF